MGDGEGDSLRELALDALEQDETWEIISISDPLPYLPHLTEWESIEVRFGVFKTR